MKLETYRKATPHIKEIELLEKFKLPDFCLNEVRDELETVDDKECDFVFRLSHSNSDHFTPLFESGEEYIYIHEHEYNQIKKVLSSIVENRIRIQNEILSKI